MTSESERQPPEERVILVEAAPPNSAMVSLLHLRRALADGWKLMIVIFVIAVVAGLWFQSRKAPEVQQKAWLILPSYQLESGVRQSVVNSAEQISSVESFLMPRLARVLGISDPVGNWFSISSTGITMILEVTDQSPQGVKTRALVQMVDELKASLNAEFNSFQEEVAKQQKRVMANIKEIIRDQDASQDYLVGAVAPLEAQIIQIETRLATLRDFSVSLDILETVSPRSIGIFSIAATFVIAGMFSVLATVFIQLAWWFLKIDPEETT